MSEKISAMPAASALTGAELVPIVQSGDNKRTTAQDIADLGGGGSAAYMVYTALLTQAGTDAPVATVLQNTLGGTLVWTRAGAGDYTGTLAGIFIVSKVWGVFNAPSYNGDAILSSGVQRLDNNSVQLYTGVELNTNGDIASIEIRVYP